MIRYIPPFILQNYENKTLQGTLTGYALLFDIADFTKIGTALQKEGKPGAEVLSKFLDEVFGAPIEIVIDFGGFVSLFAGDAFCAIFPEAKPESIAAAVQAITTFFNDKPTYSTAFGEFELKIRLTVTYGDINWQIFANDLQNEYVFYGETMKEMAELSSLKEDAIFSQQAANQIGNHHFQRTEHGFQLTNDSMMAETSPLSFQYADTTRQKFIQTRLRNEKPDNEIRSAAFCFANLEHVPLHEREEAISILASFAHQYAGFINKLDATDKGLLAIILFGMPKTEGKTLARICRFSLEAVAARPELALGISSGSVFAGYTGSGEAKEYTALGHPANLAARLMGKAGSGEILTDYYLYKELSHQFYFESIGFIHLKGVSYPIHHFRLQRQSDSRHSTHEISFVGRDEEMAEVKKIVDNGFASSQNQIVYLLGDAGIGKSRLISELINSYSDTQFHKFFLYCDAILVKPLEPIKQLMRQYFQYNPTALPEQGINDFKEQWKAIAKDDKELNRIESILASLLGYEWEKSVWSMLPPNEKPGQLRSAFCRFFTEIAKNKPVLIHLDDGHWLDEQSKEYFRVISEKEIAPVIILSACRYLENGEKPDLQLPKHNSVFMDLNCLSEHGSLQLIQSILQLDILPEASFRSINQRAMGNPFFIEQLVSYLKENNKLNSNGEIVGKLDATTSFSINDIIGARIDRLTESVRDCISNASVLGMEFNIQVLSQMLNKALSNEISIGSSNRVWKELDEIKYIFSHILIKDVVYHRMMSEKLQSLHKLAAEAMEHIFSNKLDENAEVIALHYEKALMKLKAAEYFDKAGVYCKDRYDFVRSEINLKKGLAIREQELGKEHPDIGESLQNLANLFSDQGKYEEAESLYKRSLMILEVALGEEHPNTATAINNLAQPYSKYAKYEQSESLFFRSLKIREKILGEDHIDTGILLNNLAGLYHNKGKYKVAEPLYQRCLKIFIKVYGEDHTETATIKNNMAALYYNQGKYEKAEPLYLFALNVRERLLGEDHPFTATSLSNVGNFYRTVKKYDKAEPLILRALKKIEKVLGEEHPTTALLLNNLAEFYCDQGKYDEVESLHLRSLKIREKVFGAKHPSTAMSLNNLASLYYGQGKYSEAEPLLIKTLQIKEKALGVEHPSTATSLNNLASLYYGQGKYSEAEPLFLKSLDTIEKVLGKNHPNTFIIIKRLIELYEKTGDKEKEAKYKAMLPKEDEKRIRAKLK